MNADQYEPFLTEITEADAPYEDVAIVEIQSTPDGWHCTGDSGWTMFVPSLPITLYGRTLREPIVPNVGDRMRLYGSFGHEVEGIQINDAVVFYRDQAQREAHRRRWLEDHDARQRREFALSKPKLDADFDALPDVLKARIQRFRDENPDFRVKDESYELFVCTEAVKIADSLAGLVGGETPTPADVIKAFHDKPWQEQKQLVPALDEGHSGNTFGGACMLARALMEHRTGQEVAV